MPTVRRDQHTEGLFQSLLGQVRQVRHHSFRHAEMAGRGERLDRQRLESLGEHTTQQLQRRGIARRTFDGLHTIAERRQAFGQCGASTARRQHRRPMAVTVDRPHDRHIDERGALGLDHHTSTAHRLGQSGVDIGIDRSVLQIGRCAFGDRDRQLAGRRREDQVGLGQPGPRSGIQHGPELLGRRRHACARRPVDRRIGNQQTWCIGLLYPIVESFRQGSPDLAEPENGNCLGSHSIVLLVFFWKNARPRDDVSVCFRLGNVLTTVQLLFTIEEILSYIICALFHSS